MKLSIFSALNPHRGHEGRSSRPGFTLIELLIVMSIMAVLIGMVSSTTNAARQSAYRAQATAEVRELGNALKAYWMTYKTWRFGPGTKQWLTADVQTLKFLRGGKSTVNKNGLVFLELSDKKIQPDDQGVEVYVDPWGNAYQFYLEDSSQNMSMTFTTAVHFPMRNRR